MHQYDSAATSRFFNTDFAQLEHGLLTSAPDAGLRHRDYIFLQLIESAQRPLRILDFACGQGTLLSHLIAAGHDAIGMEANEGMRRYAETRIKEKNRISSGGVDEFTSLPDKSFDVIILMGVLQYLSDDDYQCVMQHVPRILRQHGFLAATFQNSFFDLFTFNKYTVDFLMNQLVGPFIQTAAERDQIACAFQGLLQYPAEPHYSKTRARDNVFVRLTNPLTIAEDLRPFGLHLNSKFFYEWFGLPPLIKTTHEDTARAISNRFEIKDPSDWRGHFMANAFLAHIVRASITPNNTVTNST